MSRSDDDGTGKRGDEFALVSQEAAIAAVTAAAAAVLRPAGAVSSLFTGDDRRPTRRLGRRSTGVTLVAVVKTLIVAGALALLGGCSDGPTTTAGSESPSLASPTSSPAASPSLTDQAWDYCQHIDDAGRLRKMARKGVVPPEQIISLADTLRDNLTRYKATLTDEDARVAVRDLANAVGKFRLSVTSAGADYPFDSTVQLRAQTVSLAALTAGIRACEL